MITSHLYKTQKLETYDSASQTVFHQNESFISRRVSMSIYTGGDHPNPEPNPKPKSNSVYIQQRNGRWNIVISIKYKTRNLFSIYWDLYYWIHLALYRGVSNISAIFTAISVFFHDRLKNQIFPSACKNFNFLYDHLCLQLWISPPLSTSRSTAQRTFPLPDCLRISTSHDCSI